jgi:enamine deaminase RidA (YjgF/YER057c/UK114 family)
MLKRDFIQIHSLEDITCVIEHLLAGTQTGSIIGVTTFVFASNKRDFFRQRNTVLSFFDKNFKHLPVNVVAQSCGQGVAFEIWKNENSRTLNYKQQNDVNYCVYEDGTGLSLWAFGCTSVSENLSFEEQTRRSFEAMQAILTAENMSMDNLVRQWNYIPSILSAETLHTTSLQQYQHYQIFNDLRQEYYERYKTDKNYPAATGIGVAFGAVTIDFLALKPNTNTLVTGLNNPNQSDAYHYGQKVLVGSAFAANKQKKPPLFERAKYAGQTGEGIVFISGTAAIVGEKTVGLNDVVRQTFTTVRNIAALIESQNLATKQIAANNSRCAYFRVYVKIEKHLNLVRKICKTCYPDISILCVQADICRDDLLMEMEGEAITYS